MKLWDILRDRFFPSPSGLRNKRGGLAWIRGIEGLSGRIVTTVRADAQGYWDIEPEQEYVLRYFKMDVNGRLAFPGERTLVVSIGDENLEPMKNPGDEARDESLRYLPPVPTHKPVKEPA